MSTPASLGYHMPAEWELHEGTWISWPHNENSFPGKIHFISKFWVAIAKNLHEHENIHINVKDKEMETSIKTLLQAQNVDMNKIFLHPFETNDCWARDHGPIFIVRNKDNKRELALTDWEFNMWGGKYPPWDLDNQIPQKIAKLYNIPSFSPKIVLEGGSIDVNGAGCLLTTKTCLLNKNRNPHLSQVQIEQYLKDYLGVKKILWLGDGIAGDDTDGHVDDITRFVAADTIVTAIENDPKDDNFKPLQKNLELLKTFTDTEGKPFKIITIPMPKGQYEGDTRMPASYLNFYIGNGAVLVPTFNDPNDQVALDTLQKLFPTRKIVGVYAYDLVWGFGAFHCITQQQPKL
ncbi:agmatine deiminase family protein [bacterium]|nr:agmatine deiminase family protein [bacterium]